MEIQFSIPLKPSRAATANATAAVDPSASAASGRSAGAAVARGGTHRFALETRTRHTRRSSTRARTGCSTCKKRHVKCDEAKPSCQNCMKWRGYCDGYTDPDARSTRSETPAVLTKPVSKQPHTSSPPRPSKTTTLTKPKPAPLLTEPPLNTIHFTTADERLYFDEWTVLSTTFLGGSLGHSRLWTATMPQLTLQEPTLRYGAMAVGALRKACDTETEPNTPTTDLMNSNAHYLNAIIYYCEALRLQSKARPTREGLRTAMLSSLLFICFEAQRGNMPAALKHVTHGFTMLNELAACTDKAPDLVSIAPAPPTLVQEILDCYKPLELQSRSFMGSYKKFFFPPKQPQQQQPPPSNSQEAPRPPISTPTAQSPQSQPGSPWQGQQANPQVLTGLPSPQSQASPRSHGDQTSPPRAPPSRPPGIAPFTKHSPYFRPKQSNITSLDDLPQVFTSFDEAHGYWSLLQRQMVQYIPLLTATTAQLALTKITNIHDLETKLSSVKQNPKIVKFIDESRYWLQRWSTSFNPLLNAATLVRASQPAPYLTALNLRIEYLILYIYTAIPRFSTLATAQALTPYYVELNRIAETLIASRPNCGFAMDSGWTWPLFVSAFGCRDEGVRDDAIRILERYPVRNALRDSRVFRAIALKNREAEMNNRCEGTEEEQWLRLRRRELVFEDLGTNIIFRSAQKNPTTGEWDLIEEVASFIVASDGRLDWHRQPISESASILSGVC